MHTNNSNFNANGSEYRLRGQLAIPNSSLRNPISNNQSLNKDLETPIAFKLIGMLGVPAYIGAFLLNITTWKADLLFALAVVMGLIRFGFYCWKTWQIVRMNEIEIKERQKELEET